MTSFGKSSFYFAQKVTFELSESFACRYSYMIPLSMYVIQMRTIPNKWSFIDTDVETKESTFEMHAKSHTSRKYRLIKITNERKKGKKMIFDEQRKNRPESLTVILKKKWCLFEKRIPSITSHRFSFIFLFNIFQLISTFVFGQSEFKQTDIELKLACWTIKGYFLFYGREKSGAHSNST